MARIGSKAGKSIRKRATKIGRRVRKTSKRKTSSRKSSGQFGSGIGEDIADDFTSMGARYHGKKKAKKVTKNIFYRMG